jgi:hypothetical protein
MPNRDWRARAGANASVAEHGIGRALRCVGGCGILPRLQARFRVGQIASLARAWNG